MSINLNSDSDDDLFFQGGRPVPSSVYTISHEAPASSDDEDKPSFATPTKRPRGRPRHVAAPIELPRKEKRPKTSVFEISSDDEPTVVQREEPDEHDQSVSVALAHARAVLAQGDEDTLAREAEAEISRERALREQEEEERRHTEELERSRKEAAAVEARKSQQQHQASAAAAQSGAVQNSQDAIQFQVRMDEARKIRVRIRRTDPLLKILPAFCRKYGLLAKDVVMRVDGENVEENDTPESLDCDDGMQIDVAMRKR